MMTDNTFRRHATLETAERLILNTYALDPTLFCRCPRDIAEAILTLAGKQAAGDEVEGQGSRNREEL